MQLKPPDKSSHNDVLMVNTIRESSNRLSGQHRAGFAALHGYLVLQCSACCFRNIVGPVFVRTTVSSHVSTTAFFTSLYPTKSQANPKTLVRKCRSVTPKDQNLCERYAQDHKNRNALKPNASVIRKPTTRLQVRPAHTAVQVQVPPGLRVQDLGFRCLAS